MNYFDLKRKRKEKKRSKYGTRAHNLLKPRKRKQHSEVSYMTC